LGLSQSPCLQAVRSLTGRVQNQQICPLNGSISTFICDALREVMVIPVLALHHGSRRIACGVTELAIRLQFGKRTSMSEKRLLPMGFRNCAAWTPNMSFSGVPRFYGPAPSQDCETRLMTSWTMEQGFSQQVDQTRSWMFGPSEREIRIRGA